MTVFTAVGPDGSGMKASADRHVGQECCRTAVVSWSMTSWLIKGEQRKTKELGANRPQKTTNHWSTSESKVTVIALSDRDSWGGRNGVKPQKQTTVWRWSWRVSQVTEQLNGINLEPRLALIWRRDATSFCLQIFKIKRSTWGRPISVFDPHGHRKHFASVAGVSVRTWAQRRNQFIDSAKKLEQTSAALCPQGIRRTVIF